MRYRHLLPFSYRYALIEQVGSIRLHEMMLRPLEPHEVLLHVAYCGICATDLAIIDGRRQKNLPYAPGHEYSAIVAVVGSAVHGLAPGDPVVGNPNFVCQHCYFCRQGDFHLCEKADIPHYSNGAFAEYVIIDYRYVYRLPLRLDLRSAALTECLACAIHAVEQLQRRLHETILIIGAGTIGLLVLGVLKHVSRAKVLLVAEIDEQRRSIASALGAQVVSETDSSTALRRMFSPGIDAVFECSGSSTALRDAFSVIRRGGQLILVGRTPEQETMQILPCSLARNAITVTGSARYLPDHFAQAIEFLAQEIIPTSSYLDHVFPLDHLADAFQYARQKRSIKTLVQGSEPSVGHF